MSRKNNLSNQKITALYCRISLDDGSQNESMSISNQKLMLKDYAEKNSMPLKARNTGKSIREL